MGELSDLQGHLMSGLSLKEKETAKAFIYFPFFFCGILCVWVTAFLLRNEAGSCPASRAKIPKWNYWSESTCFAKGSAFASMTNICLAILMSFSQSTMQWCSSMDVFGMVTRAVLIMWCQKPIPFSGSRRLKKTGSETDESVLPCLNKAGGCLLFGSVN